MATKKSTINPIQVTPGVQPNTDRSPYNTPHFTFSDKIRFWRGVPQKIGGWLQISFELGAVILGVARTLYSCVLANLATTIIGTNSYLYSLYGQVLTNITPLSTSTSPLVDDLATDYQLLALDPVTTQIGTGLLTIADINASAYQINDNYTLAGSTDVNGIFAADINATHIIRDMGTNTISILVNGNASSSGAGGGVSVTRSTGLITATASNVITTGWRIKIAGAATTGGVLDTEINSEFLARNALTTSFQFMTSGTATSLVTGGGGAATTYQVQIAAGNVDQAFGFGYGVGFYGIGLYGVAKSSASGITYPRIWFQDHFGDRVILTPGNQGSIYIWDGDNTIAPSLLTNAPTAVNYLFVSNNILITFGYQNIDNQIFTSDINDPTNWTASSTNQVFQDIIYGAERLVSSVPVLGLNLIFTPFQTYSFSYVGFPAIWSIQLIDNCIGIIAPNARCSVNNVAYWMGQNNFYYWAGGNVEIIPSNTQDQCTFLNYVFSNINTGQLSKIYAWYNQKFNEVWFHYPSAGSNECDRVARVSISDLAWSPDTLQRCCAEYPQNLFNVPRMIDKNGGFFNHETGMNDNNNPLPFTLTSNFRTSGKDTTLLSGFVPDSVQTGTISVEMQGFLFPQTTAAPTFTQTFSIAENAGRENVQIGGRFWQYTWSGDELDQDWIMGSWFELLQDSAPN